MFWKHRGILIAFFSVFVVRSCTPTSHLHSQHHHHGSEREDDGVFSPTYKHYFDEEGDHHSEFDHEAIFGSVEDVAEFDELEPEEDKKRLRTLLDIIDLNSDELIERNELHAWILRLFKMVSEEESLDRFKNADKNEDGRVTWKEYVADSCGISSEDDDDDFQDRDITSEDIKQMQDDKVMFEAADRNKDGVLDNKEFILFSHPKEHPEMLPLVLQQTLNEKDLDSDGFISFQEFVSDRCKKYNEWLITEKEKFDRVYDKDGDGLLNGPEILPWIVENNDKIAEEVSHLFISLDDDEDGVLSFQEVLDHQIFVGSEASDYGDHINIFEDKLEILSTFILCLWFVFLCHFMYFY